MVWLAFLWMLQAAPQPAPACVVEGQVLKSTTGEPLRKARIILQGLDNARRSYGTITDEAGRFALRDVAPGRYRLSADRNGYLRQEYGQRGSARTGTTLTLEAGQRLGDIAIRLAPFAVIAGRVVDEDGEPVANVRVQALRDSYQRGRRQLVPAGGSSTNDLGEYRIFGLPAGRFYLSVQSSQNRIAGRVLEPGGSRQAEEDYVPFYYPGVTEPGMATPIEVGLGNEVRGVDFRLLRMRTYRIRGRVVPPAGAEMSRNTILLLSPRQSGDIVPTGRSVVQDSKGGFEIPGVPPGSYTLTAFLFEDGKRYSGREQVEVGDADVDGVTLTITPGFELTGTVRLEGGELKTSGLLVMLDGRAAGVAGAGSVKADGTFSIINVSPDHYSVLVRGLPENHYVKAARLGGADILDTGFDAAGGRPGGRLEIVLSPAGGRIEGTVLNEKQQPAGGATVVLVPEESRRSQTRLFQSTTTDQNGRYVLRGIAPGPYKLFAWEDVEAGAWLSPEFLRPFENGGQAVSVEENGRQTLQLQAIAAGSSNQ